MLQMIVPSQPMSRVTVLNTTRVVILVQNYGAVFILAGVEIVTYSLLGRWRDLAGDFGIGSLCFY
jgi:hypothetical protein